MEELKYLQDHTAHLSCSETWATTKHKAVLEWFPENVKKRSEKWCTSWRDVVVPDDKLAEIDQRLESTAADKVYNDGTSSHYQFVDTKLQL